jgi:pyruvate/2-oxoglutarate dehydrogenase complex dihydrolipoamide dehydrogenase (E3) component
LSLAAAGALLGVSVVLVGEPSHAEERGLSAAALRAGADRAHAARTAFDLGIGRQSAEPEIDWVRLRSHMRQAVASHASMGAPDRFRAMGVDVIEEKPHFADPETLLAGSVTIRARRFIVAPEGRPNIPAIPGLEKVPYLTEDSVMDLAALPTDLLILGSGPEAVWLAQTYRRLGSRVTVTAPEERLLMQEDPEIVAILGRSLSREGIDFRLGTEIAAFEEGAGGGIVARFSNGELLPEASQLVVAAGWDPVFDGLNLAAAKIRTGPAGLALDHHLRTTNRKVYAVDHSLPLATQQAGFAFRNAVLRLPTRFDPTAVPRLVHGAPEMASVGLTEPQAREISPSIRVLRAPFGDNSRAIADRMTEGHIKVVTTPTGRILGCSILGGRAHDLLGPWALAMAKGLAVSDLAGVALSGPAYSDVGRSTAMEYLKLSAQAPWLRRALGFVRRWG